MSENPAPLDEGAPAQLSFQELWKAADIARDRAEQSRARCIERLAIEPAGLGRDTYQGAVDGYTRTMAAFEKIMRLIDIIKSDRTIKRRLWEIAEAEAAERADGEDNPDVDNNAP